LVTINGKPAESCYEPKLGLNRISVPALAVTEPITIEVVAPEADDQPLANEARTRRIRGIAGESARGGFAEILHAVGGREKEALLAVVGIGLMPSHQSPTFADKETQLALLIAKGAVDGDVATRIREEKQAERITESRITMDLRQITEPVMLDMDHYNRIEFKIDGHACFIQSPGVCMTGNLAMLASASASSSEDRHTPASAIDGEVGGYPERPEAEWAANRQITGARFELAWKEPQRVSRIVLFDRPNTVDQVTSGKIVFSDGSTIDVGELPDDASHPLTLEFPSRTIESLAFEVTGVKRGTENAGIAEIAVY
jgi:hypothetical protein